LINTFVCTYLQLLHALQESSFWNVVKLPCHCRLNFFYCLKIPPLLREILTWWRESSRQVQDLKNLSVFYKSCLKTFVSQLVYISLLHSTLVPDMRGYVMCSSGFKTERHL
jgi:hypothetical protein